jgi:transcriptional regulator with XRE-family HTH domain
MADRTDNVECLRLSQGVRGAVSWYMEQHGVSRAQLARRMGVTPGRVSQLLSGDENLTLKTLSTIASCLGARCEFSLAPIDGAGVSTLHA